MSKHFRDAIEGAVVALSVTLAGSAAFASQTTYQPGEVIVKYRDLLTRSRVEMNELYSNLKVRKVERIAQRALNGNMEVLHLADGIKVQDAIAELERNPMVEFAQPNYTVNVMPIDYRSGGVDPDPCVGAGYHFPPKCEESNKIANDPLSSNVSTFDFKLGSGCLFTGCSGGQSDSSSAAARPDIAPAPPEGPATPDPDLGKTWGMQKIGAPEAWKKFQGSKKFLVADIDTGIDYNHEDLSFNMWRNPSPKQNDPVGYDFIHNDGLPFDDQGHGTHTTGTIGAVGANGVAISGVAPRVSVMAVKFLDAQGSGTIAGAIKSIDYAVSIKARVLSNSWGGRGKIGDALNQAVERAQAAGVLFVAAAGNSGVDNDGGSASFPGGYLTDNVIGVAATDSNDKLASFSNFGVKTTQLAAPGVDVYSSVPGNKYRSANGTSMATPHVAGAAALIWSYKPDLTYLQVKKILMDSTDKVDGLANKTTTGGRLNVAKALQMVASMGGTPGGANGNSNMNNLDWVNSGTFGGTGVAGNPDVSAPPSMSEWPFPTNR